MEEFFRKYPYNVHKQIFQIQIWFYLIYEQTWSFIIDFESRTINNQKIDCA